MQNADAIALASAASAWPELKLRPCTRHIAGERSRGIELRPGATVRDRRTVSRSPSVQAVPLGVSAPHCGRRPDSGSRLRPPSGRFHGFDRRDPDRLADVSRTDVDSLTFSHRMDALPLWGVVEQAGVGKDGTPPIYAGGSTGLHNGDRTRSSILRQLLATPMTYKLPSPIIQTRCVPCPQRPPQPGLIERPEAA